MNTKILSTVAFAFAIGLASNASAIAFHIGGDIWGIWIGAPPPPLPNPCGGFGDCFPGDNPDGSSLLAITDDGSGVPMDFMMTLPDGRDVDGSDLTMRMITADVFGDVGDPELGLASWSLWVTGDDWGLHVIWTSAANPLVLSNLGSSGLDGVRYAATGLNETLDWTFEPAGGPPETFITNFDSFEIVVVPVPEPASALLVGVGLIAATLRRRR